MTRWTGYVGIALVDLNALNTCMARVAERPAVKATLAAEQHD
ncbi:glutathionine S-transferase [Dickeya dadantii]|nr:glutathionine S-transferase [Dickeya dadantii]NPE54027.1 glutathionine S-transferase [Dickeya dadantii]NPE68710.1 glutathionine S-transferase [Dickeya dadantii]